jgi:hypothetical protein
MWDWLKDPENRKVLAWLGSGLVVVAAGLWTVFTYLYPPDAGSTRPRVQVEHDVGAGGDISVGGDVNIGLTPLQVQELMGEILAKESASVAQVEELSERLGVTNSAIATFFQILGQQNVPIEVLPATLVEIAQRHRSLLDQIG